jgi:hypothetical protein
VGVYKVCEAVNFWPQISPNLGQKDDTLFAPKF